jgi:hypothetical protein
VQVGLVAVHPQEFVIDPTALTINEGMGCAHITPVPTHLIKAKQKDGTYIEGELGDYSDTMVGNKTYVKDFLDKDQRHRDSTMIIEYHGLVPRELLPLDLEEGEEQVSLFEDPDQPGSHTLVDEDDMVEALVTIANGTFLLRGIENPHLMKDRGFISYQHDTVPNEFWGRGVCEKGYNPQKALDSELRGRIDAMALTIHPMMAMDASRMVRGANFKIAPGRNVPTNGDPNTILMPFKFGQVGPETFSQTGELERMVQMATGAMDSATPIGENRRNETSSGMSMIMSGSLKRSKRTMSNIERHFTKPFIHKAAWRYMQYAPDRYPATDVKFKVIATMGLIARELEQQNLSSMMQTVPPESPAFWMLLKGVYENSDISNREEMLPVIDQMMQQSLAKQQQPPQEDPLVAIKMQELQIDAQMEQAKLQLKSEENRQDAMMEIERLKLEYEKLSLKRQEIVLDAQIAMAAQEQDSAVTVAQMQHKESEIQRSGSKEPAPAAKTNDKPAVININTGSGKKTVEVTRTETGLKGTVEES